MIAWLYNFVICSCFGHDWELYKEGKVTTSSDQFLANYVTMKCKKCGKLKESRA